MQKHSFSRGNPVLRRPRVRTANYNCNTTSYGTIRDHRRVWGWRRGQGPGGFRVLCRLATVGPKKQCRRESLMQQTRAGTLHLAAECGRARLAAWLGTAAGDAPLGPLPLAGSRPRFFSPATLAALLWDTAGGRHGGAGRPPRPGWRSAGRC